MSKQEYHVSKKLLNLLDELKNCNLSPSDVLSDIYYGEQFKMVQKWIYEDPLDNVNKELKIIDYCVKKLDVIEPEREPHYVIYYEGIVIGFAVFYLSGGRIPIGYIESVDYEEDVNSIQYEEGWSKEEAERLNKTIKGKLVEVK